QLPLGLPQTGLDILLSREPAAVVFGDVCPALVLLVLARQILDEPTDQIVAQLPEPAELIEHQSRIGAVGDAEPGFESRQHLLNALRGILLLADPLLEAIHLLLQPAIGLLELRALAKKGEDTAILDVAGGLPAPVAQNEKAEL